MTAHSPPLLRPGHVGRPRTACQRRDLVRGSHGLPMAAVVAWFSEMENRLQHALALAAEGRLAGGS